MNDHLYYEKNRRIDKGAKNRRNGYGKKTVITDNGDIVVGVPRDRNGNFEPQIAPKRQSRLEGFD